MFWTSLVLLDPLAIVFLLRRRGYHLRTQRMLDESKPSLVSLDGYEIARERRYGSVDLAEALAAFGGADRGKQ
jgi:hypothetical protein